jgi:hypothetical protein
MNPASQDVKDMLAADSACGLTYATDLFISEMPPTPDQCVCVYDTGGFDPEAQYEYERPTVQVRVRGVAGTYLTTFALAQNCLDALHGTANYTINSARYIGIWAQGDILFVGYDNNGRPMLTFNVRIHRATA